MELRFMANSSNSSPNNSTKKMLNSSKQKQNVNSGNTATTTAAANNSSSSRSNSTTASNEKLNKECDLSMTPQHQQQRSSSSCETLEAHEGITNQTMSELELNSPLDKPLPPLPTKSAAKSSAKIALGNHTTSALGNHKNSNSAATSSNNTNLNNSQALHLSSQGIHHAQPYYQTPPTPTMLSKRDYQQPPPVPPHQNNNHAASGIPQPSHYNMGMVVAAPLTPCLDQQRRTLDRSLRNLQYSNAQTNLPPVHALHENGNIINMDGLTTRIPSLRRTRRTSGGNNSNMNGNVNGGAGVLSQNPNGGLGIPVTGSPRVQRSPMPARSAIMKQRSRLGSHNDNISQGSLNSIEV